MKKLLPFELENNPMTDDPLQLLLNFTGLVFVNKYAYWIRRILLITLIYAEFFTVVGLLRYFSGQIKSINTFMTTISILQPEYVGVLFIIVYLKDIGQWQHNVLELSSELNNVADKKFLRKLMSAKKITIIGLVFVYIAVFINLMIFLPFVGDEHEIFYAKVFSNECGQFSNLIWVLYFVSLLVTTIGLSHPVFLLIYFVFHFKFQCELLNNYFEVNIVQFTLAGKNVIEDARYQREIYRRLKVCAKKHEKLNRFVKLIKPMMNTMIVGMGVAGESLLIGSVYFIVAEISPRSNFRIYYTILNGLFFATIYCTSGQSVNNEADILFNTLCSCPWYDWNVRNRKALLMMLRDAYLDPFEINFCGMAPLNFSFMLQYLKTTYSFLAVFINFA